MLTVYQHKSVISLLMISSDSLSICYSVSLGYSTSHVIYAQGHLIFALVPEINYILCVNALLPLCLVQCPNNQSYFSILIPVQYNVYPWSKEENHLLRERGSNTLWSEIISKPHNDMF